ncbi:hypothetical protein K3U93_02600 [Mycobacterium malmoense]|uniref:Uncharacterized protein n=1 Tax=Mycobacterium malmoense TaxID=1780 RepID=A0ABX3SLL7_MYCMA|nr:hypothetical protein BST29_21215 [Mycobacterium malmoense]QZA19862.1 hypothetical protein K3U93_02600 [Mycobacterium malmoense]UNB96612.1 hypothetical protein H5T25_02600 [Mycobacterium malmoense]
MQANGYFETWRENAERRGAPSRVVAEIARRHAITPGSFEILEQFTEIKDSHGKSYFLVPPGTSGHDARNATLMTYVLNAGTDYGGAGKQPGDFPETPYSAAEVARIINRQKANRWSYSRDVRFVHRNGGRLVTTPNGILMGLGGNWIQRQFSRRGGTTWGDIFMVNMGKVAEPAELLRRIVRSGHAWHHLDLDRVLHHEERHCQQWAAKGYAGMLGGYGWELVRELVFGKANRLEEDAGLSDGGYKPRIPL